MTMKRSIRVTERSTFKSCRRYWYYSFELGRADSRGPDVRYAYGTWIHRAMEKIYGNFPFEDAQQAFRQAYIAYSDLYPLRREQYEKAYEMGIWVLTNYERWRQQNDDFDEVLGTEVEITSRVPGTRVSLTGHIDLVVRRKGRLWVVDHKNYASFVDPVEFQYDDQMKAYLWLVWRKYGEVPAGALYNQLLKFTSKTVPTIRDGKALSKDRSYVMPAELYLEQITANGFDPADYEDVLQRLRETQFIKREQLSHSELTLKHFEAELQNEMWDMSRSPLIYPNKTRQCAYCEMLVPCTAQSEGGDWREVLEMLTVPYEDPLKGVL